MKKLKMARGTTLTFETCKELESLRIPASVTKIGANAFESFKRLKNITFEENPNLTSIGKSAFQSCTNLRKIVIPASVTTINRWAFRYCRNLKFVTVEGASEPSIEGVDASVISYQVTKGENGDFSLRAIAGLNVLSYQNFGYEIALTTAEGTSTLSGVDTRVYSSIYGGGTQYSIKDTFGYEYAALATVTGLAIDSENTRLEIRAYVTAHNGEKVYGNGTTLLYIGELDADGYPVFSSVSE